MDALELQAALVKLDPATTVTPIGTTVKLVPHHCVAFTVNIDDSELSMENSQRDGDKSTAEVTAAATTTAATTTTTTTTTSSAATSRKTPGNCVAGLTSAAATTTPASHQNHQGGQQQLAVSKCGIVEVR
ncbi:cell wall protein PRY3-like [Harpegnathos saltator]|uniref:cell wall protein PRY3-like n=1 Tax=Harpegnathos saltator TaxID=610380 RepID=UPI000DBED970|nr:cell wall protein PRY3-like [Harpegnathos saltator]